MKARSLVFTVLIGAVLAAELYVLIAGGGRGTVIVTGVIALELLLAAAFLFINRDEDIAPVQAVKAELRMLNLTWLNLVRRLGQLFGEFADVSGQVGLCMEGMACDFDGKRPV
ncbi:hypothetical protein ACL1E1_12285, partial [Corynebacterium striatum]